MDIKTLQKDPILAARLLAPKELIPPHQEVTLRGLFRAENSFNSSGRSTGKTHLMALFMALWSALHPETKGLVLAQKFRTGQQVLEAMELIIRRNSELKKCVELNSQGSILTRGQAEWTIHWKNGSITRTTASDISRGGMRVRGLRCNVLILDEFAVLPIEVVEEVFLPCASIRVQGERRVILATTGGYKPSPNWDYCKRHYDEFKKGNPDYFFCNFSYKDIPAEYQHIIDHKAIEEFIKTADPDLVAREVFGRWTERGNVFIPARIIDVNRLRSIEQEIYPEFTGVGGSVYVAGCDFAFTGSDETAVTVLKRLEHRKWAAVYNYAANFKKGWAEENARLVFDVIERFNPAFIGMDRAGGEQVVNKLRDYYTDQEDCPVDVNTDMTQPGDRKVRIFVPTSTGKDNNTRLNANLLKYLDGNGDPKLFIPGSFPSDEGIQAIEDLDELRFQLSQVQATPIQTADGFFKFTANGKKDRYSSLLYGINCAIEYFDENSEYNEYEEEPEQEYGMSVARL